MKFINYLESITGIGFYPLASLLIFFVFFIGVTIFIIKGSKEYFNTLSQLPLNTDNSISNNTSYEEIH
ncbi:MAG: CcoQ/FixQ family Cbb3-type cytochrome c oxidase assembly chaperone [Bacteroidia bacterium]|nr:CcoQ/FixQ family Cbb3-type cytochrome c oxidase assembly chaperone [Bacteroidia bacterium]